MMELIRFPSYMCLKLTSFMHVITHAIELHVFGISSILKLNLIKYFSWCFSDCFPSLNILKIENLTDEDRNVYNNMEIHCFLLKK